MDTKWLMIHEAGYIASGIERIDHQDVIDDHGWEGPDAAIASWRQRNVHNHGRYQPFENGRQDLVDVTGDREYRRLGIQALISRVYFVLVPAAPVVPALDRQLLLTSNLDACGQR